MTSRPGPPPTWTTNVVHPPLRPGVLVPFELHVASSDGFELEVRLDPLPPELRLAEGSSPWHLRFAGRAAEAKAVRVVLAVSPDAAPGSELCVRFRQIATNGGVPDVVELPVVATVR